MKRDIRALAGRGKVLPFAQSGDFFYKRGLEKLDKNNLPDAMAYYGRALKCDQGDPHRHGAGSYGDEPI